GLTTPGGAVISPTFPGGCADAANRPRHPGRGPRPVVPVHRDRDRPWCATLGLRLALAPLLDRFYYDRCRRRLRVVATAGTRSADAGGGLAPGRGRRAPRARPIPFRLVHHHRAGILAVSPRCRTHVSRAAHRVPGRRDPGPAPLPLAVDVAVIGHRHSPDLALR